MIPYGSRLSLLGRLPTVLLRQAVLKTFMSPNGPRFAARAEAGSYAEGFCARIKAYDRETLLALMTVAESDPAFRYDIRIAPLPEPVLRDICAVHDMLGTLYSMSYSHQIKTTFQTIHRLGLPFVPGQLLNADEGLVPLVRTLVHLIDAAPDNTTTIHPSVIELLRDEPDSWQEVTDFANAHNTDIGSIHADQIRESRTLGTRSLQGGIL